MTVPLRFVVALSLLACGPAACQRDERFPELTDAMRIVTWEEATDLLNAGRVDMVFQAHSLEVDLVMKDRSRIRAIEPAINEIHRAIDRCGAVCNAVRIYTE